MNDHKTQLPSGHISLLLIGSLPPPIGGTTILFKQLCDELSALDNVDISVIDTAEINANCLYISLIRWVRFLFDLINHVRKCDVISFHASVGAGVRFTPIIVLLGWLFERPVIFRGFGGDYKERYIKASFVQRILLHIGMLRCHSILLETKASVSFFSDLTTSVIFWYPNSRPAAIPKDSKLPYCISREFSLPRFIFIGHVKPSKGIFVLRDALLKIDGGVRVDIYGPLMDGVSKDDLVAPGLHYCGVLQPSEVASVMAEYDCVVLPTFFEGEGYPGVILEGYALGLPTITTNWRSIPEIVTENTGVLVEPRDVNALASVLQRFSKSPESLLALKQGVLASAELYSSKAWTEFFYRCIRDALK